MDKKLKTIFSKQCGIYKIQILDHIYIGSSINIYNRVVQHRSDLRNNRHKNIYLQRCINKYGLDNSTYEAIELYDSINREDLLKREKYFIDFYKSDLNLKKDPTNEYNCITTSKEVYQFNKFGEFIKKWPSCKEASRNFKIDSSNINMACLHPKRQKYASGFLWSYDKIYKYNIEILYVFDLYGNFLERHSDTVSIYKKYFSNINQKTILSMLRKKIDSNKPFKNIYISTDINFKILQENKDKYKEKSQEEKDIDKILNNDPIIYNYSKSGKLLGQKKLSEYNNIFYIKRKIKNNSPSYSLNHYNIYRNYNSVKIIAINLITNDSHEYLSLKEAVTNTIGYTKNNYKNCFKHLQRKTPYLNFEFKRAL